jgi:hypothetical protein
MKRFLPFYFLFFMLLGGSFMSCSDLSDQEVEALLTKANAYPVALEYKLFCNSDEHVQEVFDKKLVENGFVTAQRRHTAEDIGKPLIYFTDKAATYLIATSDTLRSFDIQRIKMGEEVFVQVRNIEVNPSGSKAVVDYTTTIIHPTPFIVLYTNEEGAERKRRTFFTRTNDGWTWDGKIIKMPK